MPSSQQETDLSMSNFVEIFRAASENYKKLTKQDLESHPFAAKLDSCDSPTATLALFRKQAQDFDEFRKGDESLIRWLYPTVNALTQFSEIIRAGAEVIPFSPAKMIFTAIGVLLTTAKDVVTSHETLVKLFEHVQFFLQRLVIYTEIQLTPEIIELFGKIMSQVLSILALSTKEMDKRFRKRFRRFLKILVGKKDVEDALHELDRLTQEETRLMIAKNVGLAHHVEQITEKIMRNQYQGELRGWLSSPNPSMNHNLAREIQHEGTGSWFVQGRTFKGWTTNGSHLWICGNPGSGKSILCSVIVEEIKRMHSALIAFYYFDYKDRTKRDVRGLICSLLIQLSDASNQCRKVLSGLRDTCNEGLEQPSEAMLIQCLKDMLELIPQIRVYIIVDALDECPSTGTPSPREKVLEFVKHLIESRHPNLYLCTTSRPEQDILKALGPLTPPFLRVSLHEEVGQRQDILSYVCSFVHNDEAMRDWRVEDRDLVITTLSEKAGGMFRWVYCQLDTLHHCLQRNIRRVLDELPAGLDETYQRTLRGIPEANWQDAHRLFQCLIAAVRPLCVDELGEIFAIGFDSDSNTAPKFEENWRPRNVEDALLSSCSTLITIVPDGHSRIVQFSHFSVKEFLISGRLATSGIESVSRYHVNLASAHTILAQTCLTVLLQLDNTTNRQRLSTFPLSSYAAEHWTKHAQFEDVTTRIEAAMKRLFDPTKTHFAAWTWIFDIDDPHLIRFRCYLPEHPLPPKATPLYYAARCGFYDLAKHLVSHREDVNARGGRYVFPLCAALLTGHLDIAHLLHEHGADVNARGHGLTSPLWLAAEAGHLEAIQFLLEHQVDVNRKGKRGQHPLWAAYYGGHLEAMKLLLERGADVETWNKYSFPPLREASMNGHLDIVRLLLEHKADVNSRSDLDRTPLHSASFQGHIMIVQVLLEYGADLHARDVLHDTPLHDASAKGKPEVVRVLLKHGADVHMRNKQNKTALQCAMERLGGHPEVVQLLLEHEAGGE